MFQKNETKDETLGNNTEKQGNYEKFPNQAQKLHENCDSENLNSNCDNMNTNELNLICLLKDCPTGERFFSLMFGDVTFIKVIDEPNLGFGEKPIATTQGRYLPNAKYGLDGVPTLFPSKELYEKYPLDAKAAWDEWASERKPKRWRAKDGDEPCYDADFYEGFKQGADWLTQQPLSERLTKEEKEKIEALSSQWLKPEDELPKNGEVVLIREFFRSARSGRYVIHIREFIFFEKYGFELEESINKHLGYRITHWMRIPEIPKN